MPSTNDTTPARPGALTIADEIDALTDPDFMTSFARGLAVIRAFADSRQPQTIAQISQQTGIPRAAVRRCLHTLRQLGYVDAQLNNFTLRPKVLTLGYSYLSSTPLTLAAQPCLDGVSKTLGESSSLAVLEEDQVLYVARAATSRVMSVSLSAGSRLPAYCTSLGRVLLAHLPQGELDAYLARTTLLPRTERTITDPDRLRAVLGEVRRDGHAVNDQELELGLRSIAVPVRGASGRVLAALNVGAQAARVSHERMVEEFLPVLQRGAQELAVLLP
ncbi:IclR family transcriptional regulator C-terminal domain-containing protein [Massilia sp. YIM B02763]|uniref:IclR family transcriptional regulator domain-containing protein n=1 Tax=Massilia sp. YIM B02763 TaxID=3050130 RepID=UPI0025B6AAD1|nr:IclR family transcriptional regulator C-terminal domain-containing protein [Massilia sp. YIM B02763]MDN4054850.1 IclR family transcriptional regulator C-terminal domain-containing protein [Massilia sp. YIM B02763]